MARGLGRETGPPAARNETRLFRVTVEVGDLEQAARYYGALLASVGRKLPGARCYFDCGAVTLQVVQVPFGTAPHVAAKSIYFSVEDLDAVYARAETLKCLSPELVHGEPGGKISVRPWGERSFYAEDPWGNPLCFVEAGTVYTGQAGRT